ncbi:MAG: tetratricopeptide repeat protein [Candidatus Omnitrophota bacterium]
MPQILKRIKVYFLLFFLFLLTPTISFAVTLRDSYESAVEAYNKGQYDHAVEIYQSIIKDAPQFAPAYIGIGLSLKAKGADVEEVIYYYKTAVEKDPTNSQALEQLGRLYYSLNRLDKAQATFERALKINPGMTDVKASLGWIHLVGKNANPERAIIYFKDVIKVSPTANVYFGLGIAYFSDNQREKALDIITQLKSMGQEDLANKLEKSVRENRWVVLDEFNNPTEDKEIVEDKNTPEATTSPNTFKGVKVRLRGKLSDL